MFEFLAEVVVEALGALIPRRARASLIALLMLVCGLAFGGLAAFCIREMLAHRAEPELSIVVVVVLGLSAVCFWLAWKGFFGPNDSGREPPPTRPPKRRRRRS